MGGYNSGRYGGRPTVEGGLTLDLYRLIRQKLFRPGQNWRGSIVWTRGGSGDHVGSIGYEAYMEGDHGHVRLHYTTTNAYSGEKRDSDYRVGLTTTAQPFGGRRWWFVCPRTGALVAKLHLPSGAYTFASRRAYRLGYRSQRETPSNRAINRAFKLRGRLGGKGGIGEYIPKPKGMRWRTYDRQIARIEVAEQRTTMHAWLLIKSLNARKQP